MGMLQGFVAWLEDTQRAYLSEAFCKISHSGRQFMVIW
jgi:hypothetical protein